MDEVAFGRYRLISLIGQGGMGKVYRAHDTVMHRDVALKVLPVELGAKPGFEERFRREALTAAGLTEPIHDFGEAEGHLYLVMPIIDGIDVEKLLQRDGPMSPPMAVHIVEDLAAALEAAHAAGLVHRDVKPSNALMDAKQHVYLIDFGIVHDAGASKLTATRAIIGTVAYMASEVASILRQRGVSRSAPVTQRLKRAPLAYMRCDGRDGAAANGLALTTGSGNRSSVSVAWRLSYNPIVYTPVDCTSMGSWWAKTRNLTGVPGLSGQCHRHSKMPAVSPRGDLATINRCGS